MLAPIALRQMKARFEAVHAEIAPRFTGRLTAMPADYQARDAIYLPEVARFSRLLALPGTADLGAELNAAMKAVADANPDLAGALPQGYAGLPSKALQGLLRTLSPLQIEGDAYGLIFDYFMGQFAASAMQKSGEYFTPASIVKLIVEVIEPYHGAILDPACGSGGMFVHSADFVRRHRMAPEREISLHGVEKMADTLRLARLNLAVHGLSGDIREANSASDAGSSEREIRKKPAAQPRRRLMSLPNSASPLNSSSQVCGSGTAVSRSTPGSDCTLQPVTGLPLASSTWAIPPQSADWS